MLQADFKTSIVFKWNYDCDKPIVVNQGGTSSGKTYSILQVLFLRAINEPGVVITVVGQDIPNLKVGALRDAETIYNTTEAFRQRVFSYNKTDRVFKFKNSSIMEFKSYEDEQDSKSGKRDYLFVNEANGVDYKVYTQLALRTKRQVFIDYNPSEEFWVHENLINQPDVQLLISNYTDNPFLDDAIKKKIEQLQYDDPELWKVYGLGLTGKIEGLIFRNYHIVNGIPHDATLIANGLDFGFTNDVSACVQVYKQDGELWIREVIYENGLTNPDIASKLKFEGIGRNEDIVADSSEPKSIQEIANEGFNIEGALKGPDSIKLSIDILKRYRLNITNDSAGLKKEIKSYKWKSKNGKTLNEPVDFNNHAIDALRYVALNKLQHNVTSGQYSII